MLHAWNHPYSARGQKVRGNVTSTIWLMSILALALLLGVFMLKRGPSIIMVAWMVYLAGALAIVVRPRYGLYLILFFTLAGDSFLMPWYPFTKNFSSSESWFYLHNAIIINPLELYILLSFMSWLIKGAMQRKLHIYVTELFWPGIVFILFVLFGLVYGIGSGGNLNIALWEARPLFYLVAMMILTSNLLEERAHVSNLLWVAMIALFIKGVVGNYYFLVILGGSLANVERITDHAAAIQMNTLFILVLAVFLYRGSLYKRFILPLFVPFVLLTYLATQRRAAFLTLGIALILFFVVLFIENRRAFWLVTPPIMVIGLVYLGVFWNSSGTVGLPAQAVKSVVAENQASAADVSSNIYRIIENVNTSFTIHQKPLTGVGFGQKFYVIVPLPDISFFEWWQYLPHNSIIWIWLKMGFLGFVSMLFLVGTAVFVGVKALIQMPRGDMSAAALMGVLYIIMHFVFAYADISWDAQSMVYVGTTMGMLGSLVHIVSRPQPVPQKRWPWQPEPEPAPKTRPFPSATNSTK